MVARGPEENEERDWHPTQRKIPRSIPEASTYSLLVLMKAPLEVDTMSTINCTEEETEVETWVKLPKLTWPESC